MTTASARSSGSPATAGDWSPSPQAVTSVNGSRGVRSTKNPDGVPTGPGVPRPLIAPAHRR